MSRLFRRFSRFVGWAGWGALILLLAAVAIEQWLFLPLQQKVADLQSQVQREKQTAFRVRSFDPDAISVAELDQFYRFFPLQPALTDLLRQIYAEAAGHGLAMERGDYQYAPEAALSLARYRINLPVRGNYPQIKAFLVAILDAQPYLVLDGIRFTREQIGSQSIEAKLQFSLLVDAR